MHHQQQQQHPSGQPPEKKLRVNGPFAGGDAVGYDFQVNQFDFVFNGLIQFFFDFLAKCKSTTTTTTATTNVSTPTITFLDQSTINVYILFISYCIHGVFKYYFYMYVQLLFSRSLSFSLSVRVFVNIQNTELYMFFCRS